MAKMSLETQEQMEALGLKFLNYVKFRLKMDGAEYRDEVVKWFGQWIVARPARIRRYEAADLKLVDEFIDYAWASIKDARVPLPTEPPEPQKAAGPARVAPPPRVRNHWWGPAEEEGRAADLRVDWHAIQRQVFEQAGIGEQQQGNAVVLNAAPGQQWVQMGADGQWQVFNR